VTTGGVPAENRQNNPFAMAHTNILTSNPPSSPLVSRLEFGYVAVKKPKTNPFVMEVTNNFFENNLSK